MIKLTIFTYLVSYYARKVVTTLPFTAKVGIKTLKLVPVLK